MQEESISGLYFVLSLSAAFGYSLQNTLMASIYRTMDRLSAVAWRGLSLGLTMMPLLFFVPFAELPSIFSVAPTVLFAACITSIGAWCAANAYNHLPVGIAAAIAVSVTTIVSVVLSFFMLDERLPFEQILLISLILVGVTWLGISRSHGTLPIEYDIRRGSLNALCFGLLLGVAYTMIGSASRFHHPFFVGYAWEFGIGLFAFLGTFLRTSLKAGNLQVLGVREFWRLLLYSSPTVIGTGCYAKAISIGPVGIATAILCTTMLLNAIMARFLYGERLSSAQWALMPIVCALLAALKYVSA